jgi:hypothetical protein
LIEGNAFGCSSASAYAEAFADAEAGGAAKAFVESAFAGPADKECNCPNGVTAVELKDIYAESISWETIIVTAVTESTKSKCSSGEFLAS